MIIFLFTLFIQLANAVEGEFSYKGEHLVLSAVRYETISTLSVAGQNRVLELRHNGYSCENKLQFVQCRKHLPAAPLPGHLSQPTPPALHVHFGPLVSLDLISQGEGVAFFEGTQNILVDGKAYQKVMYLEKPDMMKATVGNPNDTSNYYSFIIHSTDISMVDTLSVTESRWAYTNYFIEFVLSR